MHRRVLALAVASLVPTIGPWAAAAEPVPTPTPTPASAVPRAAYDRFVTLGLVLGSHVSNEFAARAPGRVTGDVRGVVEYRFLGRNFAEIAYRRYAYPHAADVAAIAGGTPCSAPGRGPAPNVGDPGCVTPIGGSGSAYVDPARLTEEQLELHTSLVGTGHAYLATSAITRRTQYGYPRLASSLGIGFEILPALERAASVSASYFYYPELAGTYAPPRGEPLRLRYELQTFALGAQLAIPATPLFLEVGVSGDHYVGKQNAPGNATHRAATLGIGARL